MKHHVNSFKKSCSCGSRVILFENKFMCLTIVKEILTPQGILIIPFIPISLNLLNKKAKK